jgi:cyclic-di-AMP phosphodiesterase PgpH
MLAVNKILVGLLLFNPLVGLLPAMMTGAVLTIARNQRFALAIGMIVVILLLLQIRGSMEQLIVMLVGVTVIIYQLRDVRSRTTLIRASAVAAAFSFLAVVVTSLATTKPWPFALRDGLWAAGCGLMTGFVVQGALPLIEGAFHVATSLTLLEWCDASRPLLKRLAMDAPGTYNHSLQLGALCEAAAEAVGARGLLARVGAYYHDIGKANKPDYFIENQSGSLSRHAKLSPAMSLLIIIGHVKDGLEMAREYGLPKVLHEFIASHHGTTLVQYFYHAAAEQRKEAADRAPDEAEFRYPGPRPRSKEPAILMLADAAESSVRAMSDPTAGRIEHQVHAMVNRRLMDGQLDECDLTLKEVHLIEASLVKGLCSMYHTRIAYPTPPNAKPAPGDQKPPAAEGGRNGLKQGTNAS